MTGHPVVLVTYPLRVAYDRSRAGRKGYSTHKWDSRKKRRTRALDEHVLAGVPGGGQRRGTVGARRAGSRLSRQVREGGPDARRGRGGDVRQTARQVRGIRVESLSDEDKEHCEKEGYASVLRDCGVGGLRFVNQVKCLHLQYGHYLASGGDNVVGEWTRAELVRRGESIGQGETRRRRSRGEPVNKQTNSHASFTPNNLRVIYIEHAEF